MMRSLFSGVSGLKSHQTRMDVIGNNIANVNTIGYKASRTTFSDMLSQLQSGAAAPTDNRGGINPRQIGLGAAVESIDLLFTDSSPQQTGKNTDLALSGNGLFVLRNGDQNFYTRNGAFEFDEAGYYVLPGSGLRVQGWNASAEGILNTNALATDVIVPVGKTMEATATTQITYNGNLDKESRIIAKISATPGTSGDSDITRVTTEDTGSGEITSVNVDGKNAISAVITFRDGTSMTVTDGYYEVGHSMPVTTLATVYDSLGGKHEVTLLLDKAPNDAVDPTDSDAWATGTEVNGARVYNNRWRCYIAPGVDTKGPKDTTFKNTYTRSEANGNPELDGSGTTGTMNSTQAEGIYRVSYLYFNDKGRFVSNGSSEEPSITFDYFDGNGAASGQQAIFSFDGLTQYANSTTSFPTTNGNTAGVLQSVAVDSGGIISGTYTNGLVRTEAQIAVAQFSNASGLTKVGTTIYTESNNSGIANVKRMSDFGLTVVAAALEMSNVDLANEFAEMIVTQRGFQANSKMTTVADEMLETVVNMKR